MTSSPPTPVASHKHTIIFTEWMLVASIAFATPRDLAEAAGLSRGIHKK